MRWVTFRRLTTRTSALGLWSTVASTRVPPETTLLSLLGDDGERLAGAADIARRRSAWTSSTSHAVHLLAPIPHPPTVRDFYAFEQHVRTARQRRGLEMDPDWYELPVFYFSNPYAIGGPDDVVPIPPGCAEMDYELEVAALSAWAARTSIPRTRNATSPGIA